MGYLEMQKCIKKLDSLKERVQGKTRQQELRNVSGRAITDLEMCSTLRGAVEVHNLCRNLNSRDVLFAECIRTFTEHTLLGREWMQYLEALMNQQKKASQEAHAECGKERQAEEERTVNLSKNGTFKKLNS